jgi:hypothetical protein
MGRAWDVSLIVFSIGDGVGVWRGIVGFTFGTVFMVGLRRTGRRWKISGFVLCNVERCRHKGRLNLLFSPWNPNIFDVLRVWSVSYV